MEEFEYDEADGELSNSDVSLAEWTGSNQACYDSTASEYVDVNGNPTFIDRPGKPLMHGNDQYTASSSFSLSSQAQNVDVNTVLQILQHCTDDMAALTRLSVPACILLLSSTRWHSEAAKEAYFIDPSETFARLHISLEAAQRINKLERSHSKDVCCAVCLATSPSGKAFCLTHCKHFFCKDCWMEQIRYLMRGGGSLLLDLRCLQHGCNELVSLTEFLELFDDADACRHGTHDDDTQSSIRSSARGTQGIASVSEIEKIRQAYAACFVNAFPRLRWCSNSRGCTGILYLPEGYARTQTVVCDVCRWEQCFRCGHSPHEPATCENILAWENMHHSGEISVSVILSSTKRCPHCGMNVLKNGGCNHMTCWQGCMGEFCWICGQMWSATHKCESAIVENALPEECGTAVEKNELSARLHKVVTAYMEHLHSDVIETSIFAECIKSLPDRVVYVKSIPHGQVALNVLLVTLKGMQKTLHKARLLLAHAYVRRFFLQNNLTEARILDCTQWKLQQAAEKLSSLLNDLRDCKALQLTDLQASIKLVDQWTRSNLVS